MSSKNNTGNSPEGEIFTIGHSVHPLEKFMILLKTYHIQLVVDIRTLPGSRRAPQYNRETLAPSLEAENIAYLHMKELGGLRHTTKASPNMGWRNKSFRGFADYMQTPGFTRGLEVLAEQARKHRTVIMCAEAVPWRCHRSLVGDALLVRGFEVTDIFTAKKSVPHTLTSFAHVDGFRITYPAESDEDAKK